MNHVRVSEPGYSVLKPDLPRKQGEHSNNTVKEMVATLSLAFIFGATAQIGRFKEAYAKTASNPQASTLMCLHEALSLLEDLDTLSWYTQKCGEVHPLNKTIRDMRNHARHDLRENIDHSNHDGRNQRKKKLGIHPSLLVSLSFDANTIKIGTTELTLNEASLYIEWATDILTRIMAEGIKAGRIDGAKVT